MTPQDVAKKIEEISEETGYAFTSIGQNACGNAKLYERSLKAPEKYSSAINRLNAFLADWRKLNGKSDVPQATSPETPLTAVQHD